MEKLNNLVHQRQNYENIFYIPKSTQEQNHTQQVKKEVEQVLNNRHLQTKTNNFMYSPKQFTDEVESIRQSVQPERYRPTQTSIRYQFDQDTSDLHRQTK